MDMRIIKSSGIEEDFDREKLAKSLVRSGAPADIAYEIARQVELRIHPSSRTRDVYRIAKKLLRQYSAVSGMRYSIKKAIFSLGPSGYPFEKYFSRILQGHGYDVEINRFIEGYCVRHEVDVVAASGDTYSVIECKYHSDAGKATDVKAALYVQARFEDIKKAEAARQPVERALLDGWLVTNTRCTVDALRYAECAGLRIVSWRYPEKNSLERMIEDRRLYPVTILNSVKRASLDALFRADIILAQDIADMDEKTLTMRSGLDENTARTLKREADAICPCTGLQGEKYG
jgi:hypothetical protein